MAVVLNIFSVYDCVVAIDSHRAMIMRNGEREDLSVHLLLPLDHTEKLDDAPYREGHAVRILTVGNIKRRGSALNLAC